MSFNFRILEHPSKHSHESKQKFLNPNKLISGFVFLEKEDDVVVAVAVTSSRWRSKLEGEMERSMEPQLKPKRTEVRLGGG